MSSPSDRSNGPYPNNQQQMPYPQGYNPWTGPPPPPMMPGQWMQPWTPAQFSGPQPWMPTQSVQGIVNPNDSRADEYMVNSMRRIYSNEDSSIEIERVKVQRRPPTFSSQGGPPALTFPGYPQPFHPGPPGALRSMVPVAGPQLPPVRRPPPRKHRKNRLNNELIPAQVQPNSYAPYYPPPYMPYMPYPYPYPYPCFSYVWPPASQSVSPELKSWDDSKRNKPEEPPRSQQRSLPASPDSQRQDSGTTRSIRDSITPESGRPLSPNAPSQISQITESQATDIGPSDSVSVGGYFKGSKDGPFKSPANRESDWMVDMQRNLANIDTSSDAGDRSSFTTAPSDLPSPPSRRNKRKDSFEPTTAGADTDDAASTLTYKSESDINLAFKDLEQSVGFFTKEISKEPSNPTQHPTCTRVVGSNGNSATKSNETSEVRPSDADGRSSTASFHSTRNASDIVVAETDSTDIFIATDTATADEDHPEARKPPLHPSSRPACTSPALEGTEPLPGEGYKWVLQGRGEAPDLTLQQGTNTWLTDVSLWRARLVVSLDRGLGLDQQDWATFHLLIQHPLPLNLKLSLLHAPRICAANTDVGAVRVRTALLQLARHAQVLLQTEDERPSGWRSITAHNSQPWMPVKGGIELLHILGYRNRDDGTLKYSRRLSLEASHLARLTLDLLVFADELRLYLTGGHPHPTNISDLFCPIPVSSSVSPEPLGMQMCVDKLSSSFASSTDFVSAESTPVMERKNSIRTEDNSVSEIDSVHHSVKVDYNQQLLDHRTSSEEDVTLNEEDDPKIKSKTLPLASKNLNQSPNVRTQRLSTASSLGARSSANSERLSVSTDMTSLPDLQTMSSLPPSRLSNVTKFDKQSDCSVLSTPVASPLPPTDNNDIKNQKLGRREDHIYEEIGEIRAQVQKLRSSVSVPNLPPPLPPKVRPNQDDENSVTYSRSDWSAVSSVGGSVGRRRRKRRAPLPPSFLYEDQIRENHTWEDEQSGTKDAHNTTSESISSFVSMNEPKVDINPFYEEIGEARPKLSTIDETNQKSKTSNPFYDTKPIPSGFVGANPFYEDISALKSSASRHISQTGSTSDETTANMMNSSIDLQFDQSDGKTPPVAASRPKRKAPRPPKVLKDETLQDLSNQENKQLETPDENGIQFVSKKEESRGPLPRYPSDYELQDVDLNSTTEESVEISPRRVNVTSKNVNQKQLPSSQVVVSVNGGVSESENITPNNNSQGEPISEFSPTSLDGTNAAATTATKILSESNEKSKTVESHLVVVTAEIGNKSLQNKNTDDANKISTIVDTTDSITSEINDTKIEDVPIKNYGNTSESTLMDKPLQTVLIIENDTIVTDDLRSESMDLSKKILESSDCDDSPTSSDPTTILSNKLSIETQTTANVSNSSNQGSEALKMTTESTATEQLEQHPLSEESISAVKQVIRESQKPGSKIQSPNGFNKSDSETTDKVQTSFNDKTKFTGDNNESKSISTNVIEDCSQMQDKFQTVDVSPPPIPQKAVLNLIDDIPYIDNNDVKNYKYAMVQAKRSPRSLRQRAVSPIEFLQKSIPFIDENYTAGELEPPLLPPPPPPPSNPPPLTPTNSPPETPPNSPPATPPLVDAEDTELSESSSGEKLLNRLSKISETTELDENKSDKINEKDELTSPILFGNPEIAVKKPERVSSGYYEIPETPECPPPLPVKPPNLRNVCLLQRTPEIPPKLSRVLAPKDESPATVTEEGRYEIPEVTKANAMATQPKASSFDTTDDASVSTTSYLDSTADESSNPKKPTRRRRHSSVGSPPRPPKTFSGQFPAHRSSSQPTTGALTLPAAPRSPTLSVSTPSTPKPLTRPKLQQSVPEKSRKSWPFLFCDCIDTNYEANTNNRSRPRT